MKARRAILGLVVFGGLLVLILAWAGVFSSREAVEPAPDNPSGPGQDIVGKAFRTEGPNWVLTAPEAAVSLDGDSITLTKPVLEVTELGGKPDQRLKLEADSGAFARKTAEEVELKGHIVVTLSGPQNAVLKTEALHLNMTESTGRTDEPLDVTVSTKDGMQTLHGRGAEFNVKQRTVTILSDIKINVTGASILPGTDLPGKAPSAEAPPAPVPPAKSKPPSEPIQVTCDGPAMADGFKRTVELHGNVVMEQGDRRLAAKRVDLQFPESGVEPDRLVARENVTFKAGAATGTGDLLVRTRAEGLMLLSGAPALVTQDTSEIRADRIEMDAATNRISVPVKGSLLLAPAKEGAQEISVQWSSGLGFDPAEHTAVFRGGVLFTRGDQTIQCQTLRVRMDESNRQVTECFAEGDVRVTGKAAFGRDVTRAGGPQHMRADALSVQLTKENQLQGFEATGNVSIEEEARRLTGDKVVAAAGPDGRVTQLVATGHVLVRETPAAGQVARTMAADKAVSTVDAAGLISGFVATGHVVITEGARKMRAEHMVVTVGTDRKLQTLVATGGTVVVEQEGRTARGALLDWNVGTGLGVLTGSPVELRQGRSKLYGDRIEFSKELGSMRISSAERVEGTIERRQPNVNF